MPLRIADLTTDYGNIGGQIANLGNQFFSGFNNARKMGKDQQRQQTLAGLAESFKQGQDPDWTGAARSLMGAGDVEGGIGLLKLGEAATQRRQAQQQSLAMQSMLMGGGMGGGQSQPMRSNVNGDAASAIAGIESGGRYDALGPVTRTGDRAYGKYQVMGANIPQWTRQYLGREMSPEEFVASPEAQDAVFQGEFGRLSQKHGPEGAARAWFAGEGGMNDPGRKDILGTSVADYGRKFSAAYGGGQPQPSAPDGTPIVQAQQPGAMPAQAPQRATSSLPPDDPFPNATNQQLMAAMGDAKWGDAAKMALQKRYQYAERMEARNAPTEAQKNYEAAKRDGFRGSFVEYQQSLRPGTNVNIDNKGETKFAETLGKELGERVAKIANDGDAAIVDKALVGQLRELGSQIKTGGWAAFVAAAADRGLKLPGAPTVEAYAALIDRLTPQQRVPGSGATSDFDAKMFKGSLPRLINSPEGNKVIVDTLDALADLRAKRGEIAGMIMNGDIDRKEGMRQLSETQKQAAQLSRSVAEAARAAQQGRATPQASQGPMQAPAPSAPPQPQQQAPQSQPNEQAIQYLMKNPQLRQQFDEKYGPGAADRALRGGA